jgi:kinesin family protein 1
MSQKMINHPRYEETPVINESNDNSRVRVVIRIRPLSTKELNGAHKNILEGGNHRITAWDPTAFESTEDLALLDAACWSREFAFDKCLWSTELNSPSYASQSDVFDEVGKPVLDWILGGYNCCVFAFGQTGAGV